jgi:hypothetical protein
VNTEHPEARLFGLRDPERISNWMLGCWMLYASAGSKIDLMHGDEAHSPFIA